MDLTILLIAASTLVVLIVATLLLRSRLIKPEIAAPQATTQEAAGPAPRRAQAVRNVRQRLRANAQAAPAEDSEEEDTLPEKEDIKVPSGKIGTKKRAKLEAKAERKVRQEAEEREREDRKKRREAQDEERKKEDEREKAEEEARLAEEKRLREEKEKREHEEYLKLKSTFAVAEEGYDQADLEDEANLLQRFIDYIKCNKVVILEDLAAHFKLKTQNVIDRIQEFQANGTLTGVIDDRGKFIYISTEELQSVANFIKQRGRVSIVELAESSNKLINLSPVEISS